MSWGCGSRWAGAEPLFWRQVGARRRIRVWNHGLGGQALLVLGEPAASSRLGGCRAEAEEVRRGWPFLRDRRIDAYQDLNARYLD